ncbi:hypothetical protein ZOSMA_216G00230 [Zostera marina]|uniref:E3 ubiquitin-protein ligase RBBP6 n=1 Tax=Zostera marina TaxID=29655 RepID=A0A0K9PJX0_ZOSMR|nr:hypothetical protein ZOSMA_216G00230 [Zostera marina]
MPVRFKFRSSVGFDSIEIGDRPFISIGDLRNQIVMKKKLKTCQGFNLVISDSETGAEYMCDDYLLSNGSSVVIKRVPDLSVSRVVQVASGNSAVNHLTALVPSPSHNVNTIDFDDFGNDIYPAINLSTSSSDGDVESPNLSLHGVDDLLRSQKRIRSNTGEYFPRDNVGDNCNNIYENMNERKKTSKDEEKWMDTNYDECSPTEFNLDLPVEFKCPLCNTIFKQAVMIPCCQHSFCYECICSVLFEKSKCPKCSSAKFGISDLLPNLTLRQTVEYLPNFHVLKSNLEKINSKDIPDEESGIHMKDVSYGVSIKKHKSLVLDSSIATKKGSNIVMDESNKELLMKPKSVSATSDTHAHHMKSDKFANVSPSGMKEEHTQYKNSTRKDLKHVDDAQCQQYKPENIYQVDKANVITKKSKEFLANTTDFGGSMMPATRYREGARKCYMCGSLEHLIRDCPIASKSHSMFQGGDPIFFESIPCYEQYYWNNTSFSQTMPYKGIYDASGMMSAVVPLTPFAHPSYMTPIYSGFSQPWVPVIPFSQIRASGLEYLSSHTTHTELLEAQDRQWNNTLPKECIESGRTLHVNANAREKYHYIDSQKRSCDHGEQSNTKTNTSRSFCSSDSLRMYDERAKCSDRPCYHRSEISTRREFSENIRHAKENYHFSRRKAIKRDLSDGFNKTRQQKYEHKINPEKHHDQQSNHLKTQKYMDFRSMHSRDTNRDFYRDDCDKMKRRRREN